MSIVFDTPVFWRELTGGAFVVPALLVLLITVVAQTAGVVLGFPLALGKMSSRAVLRLPVEFYLFIFRGTPLLLQILIVFDGTAELSGNSPWLYPINRNAVIAGIFTLALNEAAYMTEIIRSGLQAVDPGQVDAARALGMTRWQVYRRVVIPQTLRIIVPPTTNEFINMSKNTSLLAAIAVGELLYTAQSFYSSDFRYFEALLSAAVFYLLIYTVLVLIQSRVESRFGERQDPGRTPGGGRPGMMGRWLRFGRGGEPVGGGQPVSP